MKVFLLLACTVFASAYPRPDVSLAHFETKYRSNIDLPIVPTVDNVLPSVGNVEPEDERQGVKESPKVKTFNGSHFPPSNNFRVFLNYPLSKEDLEAIFGPDVEIIAIVQSLEFPEDLYTDDPELPIVEDN